MQEYAVMMLTCDSYTDIWPIFFGQFAKNWKDFDGTFFINTESNHGFESNSVNVKYPNRTYDAKHNCSSRLRDCSVSAKEAAIL